MHEAERFGRSGPALVVRQPIQEVVQQPREGGAEQQRYVVTVHCRQSAAVLPPRSTGAIRLDLKEMKKKLF